MFKVFMLFIKFIIAHDNYVLSHHKRQDNNK